MPDSFTSVPRVYDFVLWEVEERYTRVAGTIQNKTGATISAGAIVPGTPLNLNGSQWETINAGAEAGIDGFFVDSRKHEELANDAITEQQYQILVNGPAMINQDALPTNDLAGPTAYTRATILTRLAALVPEIKTHEEPDTQEEQTT